MRGIWLTVGTAALLGLSACQPVADIAPAPAQPSGDATKADLPTSGPAEAEAMRLPIEVLGPDGFVRDVAFNMGASQYIQRLRLRCSRCGYRDSLNDADRTKASVRFNDGPWLPINSATAILDDKTRDYGGLSGGFLTTDIELEVGAWSVEGRNMLSFRFEGTDGFTNGFRIVDVDLLSAGGSVLPSQSKGLDDPSQWAPKRDSDFEIERGRQLWTGERGPALRESPLTNARWTASCADCHASDGRDLKYFNYSNFSIEQRARFHGLDTRQAERISSYIRSLDAPAPVGARPWNPPYQPGPGLDAQPVESWAAGAGLDAVLETDQDMMAYLFPEGTGFRNVRSVIDRELTLNVREMPVSVQFPDWKSWLPEVHPKDMWPGLWDGDAPQAAFDQAVADFTEKSPDDRDVNRVKTIFADVNREVRSFIARGKTDGRGSQWRTTAGEVIDARDPKYTAEEARRSIAAWNAVKQWEIVQRFGLEDDAPRLHPEGGELRSWPAQGQNVHPMAPHITAPGLDRWAHQTELVGDYQSSVWYQLQMTLNAGQRQSANVQPQDWPYQLRHVVETGERSGRWEPARYLQSVIKAYQSANNGKGTGSNGWQLRFTHPFWAHRPTPTSDGLMAEFDAYGLNLRRRMTNSVLLEFLDHVEPMDTDADWFRDKDGVPCTREGVASVTRWWCVAPKTQVPVVPNNPFNRNLGSHHADQFWVLIPELRELGVPDSTITRLQAWCETMWPAGDWDTR